MKTYKIGEIAKMLGISPETIRNYERKGMIDPYKEESTQYRYYDVIQINHLMNIQKYQRYGYTLQQIKDIMKNTSMLPLEMSLEEKQADLLEEAFYMNLRLHSINENMQCMLQAQNAKQGCFMGKRPAMYRLSYQNKYELDTQEVVQQELVKWLKHADLPFMSGSTSALAIMNGTHAFDFGFCMYKQTAEYIGIKENAVVKYYDSCPAILFYYEVNANSDMKASADMVLEYAREHGVEICGESVTRVIFANWKKEDYTISHLVWIPIKKIEHT